MYDFMNNCKSLSYMLIQIQNHQETYTRKDPTRQKLEHRKLFSKSEKFAHNPLEQSVMKQKMPPISAAFSVYIFTKRILRF